MVLSACAAEPKPIATARTLHRVDAQRRDLRGEHAQYTAAGTFAALRPHLARLKGLGIDILWVMRCSPSGS